MNNNDILRRIRFILDFSDSKMISLFALTDVEVTREQISDWLKKEEDSAYQECGDTHMATFLNGLIIDRRGKKDGPLPEPEQRLNNNIIFRKLKIAFDLKDDDIIALLNSVEVQISKHELSAFFRRAGHKHFRICNDQILRNFLKGLQLKYRSTPTEPDSAT